MMVRQPRWGVAGAFGGTISLTLTKWSPRAGESCGVREAGDGPEVPPGHSGDDERLTKPGARRMLSCLHVGCHRPAHHGRTVAARSAPEGGDWGALAVAGLKRARNAFSGVSNGARGSRPRRTRLLFFFRGDGLG
jgi:hypothetical protein